MASLSTKVKLYCAANSKTVDFTTDVLLQDDSDGKGPYIKTWNNAKLQNLLNIVEVKNKDILFKYTIDNEIQESEIRNEINYRLHHYKEIELGQKAILFNQKVYNLIITNRACRCINYPPFELLQINQKRFLFLSVFPYHNTYIVTKHNSFRDLW